MIFASPALEPLTDVIALPAWLPFTNIISIGDLLIGAGIADRDRGLDARRPAGHPRPPTTRRDPVLERNSPV